jgi:hypothetical protein
MSIAREVASRITYCVTCNRHAATLPGDHCGANDNFSHLTSEKVSNSDHIRWQIHTKKPDTPQDVSGEVT